MPLWNPYDGDGAETSECLLVSLINGWLVLKVRAALFDADITADHRGPLPLQLRPVKKHQPSPWKRKTGCGLAWAVWTVVAFKPLLASVQQTRGLCRPRRCTPTPLIIDVLLGPLLRCHLCSPLSYVPQPSKRARFTCDVSLLVLGIKKDATTNFTASLEWSLSLFCGGFRKMMLVLFPRKRWVLNTRVLRGVN